MEGASPVIKNTPHKSHTPLLCISHGPKLTYMATPSCNGGHTILTSFWASTCPAENQALYCEGGRGEQLFGDTQLSSDIGMNVLLSKCICPALWNWFMIGTISGFWHILKFSREINTHWVEITNCSLKTQFLNQMIDGLSLRGDPVVWSWANHLPSLIWPWASHFTTEAHSLSVK